MKARVVLLVMVFALAGIAANFVSASPRPQSTAFSAACSASVSGQTSYIGLIQSPTSAGSFRLLRANTGGSTVVTVSYTSSVPVCQGAQQVSANSLVPGVGVAVYGRVMISGGSSKMIAQRIVLQITNAQASSAVSGAPPAESVASQGPPPAEDSVPAAQTTTPTSTPYTANPNLHPTNVTTVNTAALQTASTSNSSQSQSALQTQSASTGEMTNSTGDTPTNISCASFSMNLSAGSSASAASGLGVAANSSAAVTCGVPLNNSSVKLFESVLADRSLNAVSLDLQNNQIIVKLSNARIAGIGISSQGSQGSQGMMNLVFNCQRIEIDMNGQKIVTGSPNVTGSWNLTQNSSS